MEISFDIFDISFDKVGIAAGGDVQPAVGTHGLSVRCRTKITASSRWFGDGRTDRVTRCRDARSERPLCQRLQHRGFNGDGRTDRASLQRVTRIIATRIAGSGTSYSSLRLFFVILIAIPACHIVFDVSRYVVALFAIPNDTIVVP